MSVPNEINDGNWSALQRSEGGSITFPFSDRGDNATWQQQLHYKIDRPAYRPRPTMSRVQGDLGVGYLTKLGDVRDTSCGLVEWEDTISALPAKRTESGAFAYTYQWWRATTGDNVDPSKYFYNVNFDIEEQTFTVDADYTFEYFLFKKPQPLIKPRVFLLYDKLMQIGGTPVLGNQLVAEDSQVTIWEAQIYERKTPFVKVNSVGQLVT